MDDYIAWTADILSNTVKFTACKANNIYLSKTWRREVLFVVKFHSARVCSLLSVFNQFNNFRSFPHEHDVLELRASSASHPVKPISNILFQ